MNVAVDELTKSFTNKNSFNEFDETELQQLASRYPYFGPLQLLLTQKMKESASPLYEKQLQKTFLYFQNSLWLRQLLHTDTAIKNIAVISEKIIEVETPATVEEVTDQTNIILPAQEIVKEETPQVKETDTIIITTTENNGIVTENTSITETPFTDEAVVDQTGTDSETETITEETGPLPNLTIPGFKIEPFDPSKTALSFAPYHTVDYFASQGIKFKEEEKPKDRFTQQLKSFTEWLKDMKRMPVAELAAATTAVEEKKVEQMAEISITDRQVVTEAMAEVWEKQGNKDKAAEIYQKLSLLNPDKSAYFAAKIDQLKHL